MHIGGVSRRTGRGGRWMALAVASLLATFLGVAGVIGTAGAHGAEGEITVITAEPAGPLAVRLQIGLLYSNDEEPAVDATVTVTGVGPDGNTLEATPLPREDGAKYGATIDGLANGPWTFTITSVEPTAEATADVEVLVSQSTSSTTPDAIDTEPESTTTIAPEDIDDPSDTPTTLDETTDAAETSSDDDSNQAVLAVIALAAVGVIVGATLYLRSRRPTDESTDSQP